MGSWVAKAARRGFAFCAQLYASGDRQRVTCCRTGVRGAILFLPSTLARVTSQARPILQETLWGPDIGGALWPFQPLGWKYLRPLHIHDQTEVLLMRTGSLRLTLGHEVFELRRGHLAWIAPSVEHRVDDLSEDVDFWSLQVEPSLLRSATAAAEGPSATDSPQNAHERAFSALATALPATPVVELKERHFDAIQEAAHRAWSTYLSRAVGQEPPNPRCAWIPRWDPPSTRAAREALLACYRAMVTGTASEATASPKANVIRLAFNALLLDPSLSRRELSARFGVSDGHLSRHFPEVFGTSLVDQRARLRLVRFLALAKTPAVPNLLRSSLEAGFGSYAQLYRVFTAYSAHTPSEYILGAGRLEAGSVVRAG